MFEYEVMNSIYKFISFFMIIAIESNVYKKNQKLNRC